MYPEPYVLITQAGTVLSWGRASYGRLGRQDIVLDDLSQDAELPEPMEVDGLEGINVVGASAGMRHPAGR